MGFWGTLGSIALGAINPLLGGAMAAGGQLLTNQANRRQAREQMAFQERMSSTQAQRAQADFAAAGLNPALAYGHQAAAPLGARAEMGNSVGQGISTALNVKQAMASTKLTEAQASKTNEEAAILSHDRSLRELTGPGEPSWRDHQIAVRRDALAEIQQRAGLRPEQMRQIKSANSKVELENAMLRLGLPKAQNEAYIQRLLGPAAPALGMLGTTAKTVASLSAAGRGLRGARAAKKFAFGPGRP